MTLRCRSLELPAFIATLTGQSRHEWRRDGLNEWASLSTDPVILNNPVILSEAKDLLAAASLARKPYSITKPRVSRILSKSSPRCRHRGFWPRPLSRCARSQDRDVLPYDCVGGDDAGWLLTADGWLLMASCWLLSSACSPRSAPC